MGASACQPASAVVVPTKGGGLARPGRYRPRPMIPKADRMMGSRWGLLSVMCWELGRPGLKDLARASLQDKRMLTAVRGRKVGACRLIRKA